MPVLDEQGRLFGKVNIIDAAVLAVVLLLIPLSYAAYLLFRTPSARILAIEPAQITQGTTQVNIRGEHLRPYLRIMVGPHDGRLLFENPDVGVLPLPPLAPGSYDVVLYDESQELMRLPAGLAVVAPPVLHIETPPTAEGKMAEASRVELVAIGAFRGLDAASARALSKNLATLRRTSQTWGRILGFQPPEPHVEYLAGRTVPVTDGTYQIRAVLQFRCKLENRECRAEGVAITPGASVPVRMGDSAPPFLVEELHPAYPTSVELVLRTTIAPEIATLLASRDSGTIEGFPARDAFRPSVVSYELVGETPDQKRVALVRLRVPAVRTPEAWLYRANPLRVGDDFTFERPLYAFRGSILSINAARTGTRP